MKVVQWKVSSVILVLLLLGPCFVTEAFQPLQQRSRTIDTAHPVLSDANRNKAMVPTRRNPFAVSSVEVQVHDDDDDDDESQMMFLPDLTQFLQNQQQPNDDDSLTTLSTTTNDGLQSGHIALAALSTILVGTVCTIANTVGFDAAYNAILNLLQDPQSFFQTLIDSTDAAAAAASNSNNITPALWYGAMYCIAELLAVPAIPLTVAAGYLFGLTTGVTVVLCAATIAACLSFLVGKTLLRSWVRDTILSTNPTLQRLDTAIGKQGFPVLLVLRLSPVFPFALSNYVYGASSIGFVPYVAATVLGFAPGTCAYVYTGMMGKAMTATSTTSMASEQPWYVYAGGLAVLALGVQVISQIAGEFLETIDEGEDEGDTVREKAI